MATTNEALDLTEEVFEKAELALDETYTERTRRLGDSSCKAGIEATINYLSEKSQLSDTEIEMLSAGNIPEPVRKRDFEAHIKQLNETTNPKLNGNDERMCEDAFASGLSAAIYYLLKAARTKDIELLSLIPRR